MKIRMLYVFLTFAWCFPTRCLLAIEQIIEVPTVYNGALLVNSKAHKLYAGWGDMAGTPDQVLWVFDIQPDSTISATDERCYPNSQDLPPGTAGGSQKTFSHWVRSMALSRDGRKLYLGLQGALRQFSEGQPLVVYDLDEKGEPKGKPRSYKIGDFWAGISHLLLHPRLDLLICIGDSGSEVWAMPLRNGEPTGEPGAYRFGSRDKDSMLASDKFDSLIFGARGSTVEVVDVNPAGEVDTGTVSSLTGPSSQEFFRLARVDHHLYFVLGKQLWVWPLDREWHPTVKPQPKPDFSVFSLWEGSHSFLYLVLGEWAEDKGKPPKLVGTKLARYKPDAKGDPGKPEFVSDVFPGKMIHSIARDETSGATYVTLYPL